MPSARERARRIEGCTLEAVADLDNLYDAANGAAAGVRWKSSVQRYMARIVPNIVRARRDLSHALLTSGAASSV